MPQDNKAGRTHSKIPSKPTPDGVNWLLVVAIDEYQHCAKLRNCVNDAKKIIKVLQGKYQFEQVIELYNEAATKTNIVAKLNELSERINKDVDNLILYFSGHGETEGEEEDDEQIGYIIPVEATSGDESQYIPHLFFRSKLNRIRTKHTFVIIDACFAGSFFYNIRSEKRTGSENLPSRWGISSSSSHEVAFDGAPGDNSPFATCLLAALENNDTPLGIHGLAAAVENRMQAQRAKQTPICLPFSDPNKYSGQFYFHPKQNEASAWAQAEQENSIAAYEDFLKIFPNSDYLHDALLAILKLETENTKLKAEKEWQIIEVMPDEEENQVLDKLRAIDIYLSKITVDIPTFQKAENLGEVLNYKHDFLKAYNNLFTLRRFARQETPFQAAALKRITELEARLRQKEREEAEKKAAEEETERKRQNEDAENNFWQRVKTIYSNFDETKLREELAKYQKTADKPNSQKHIALINARLGQLEKEEPQISNLSTRNAPRRKNYLPYGIGAALSFVIILMIWQPWKSDTATPPYKSDNPATTQTIDNSPFIEPEMVFVTGGTFQMGSSDGESDEKPVHTVTVSDFYISKHEVTFDEYDAFCDATKRQMPEDEGWGRGKRPVINVSWDDANAYCKWLSEKMGQNYRLPTEAEWDYAARGGAKSKGYKYAGSDDLDKVAYYRSNASGKTHPVGSKTPNELGLYDMSGNVWEWCSDWYGENYYQESDNTNNPKGPKRGTYRVLRGGSWNLNINYCRVSDRYNYHPVSRLNFYGFRLSRDL